jgi:hypothetical protein
MVRGCLSNSVCKMTMCVTNISSGNSCNNSHRKHIANRMISQRTSFSQKGDSSVRKEILPSERRFFPQKGEPSPVRGSKNRSSLSRKNALDKVRHFYRLIPQYYLNNRTCKSHRFLIEGLPGCDKHERQSNAS